MYESGFAANLQTRPMREEIATTVERKIDGGEIYGSRRVSLGFAFGLEREESARRARKRARRHGALLTISRGHRSHPRSPPLVCHPTNSLSAARERSQVRVRRAYTLSRAPRSSLARARDLCYARKIIIILTVRAVSNQRDSTLLLPVLSEHSTEFYLNISVVMYSKNNTTREQGFYLSDFDPIIEFPG